MKPKMGEADIEILLEIYKSSEYTVDELPYTSEFERLYNLFVKQAGHSITKNEFWKALTRQRKRRRLTRKILK